MDREEAITKLKKCQCQRDAEAAHLRADEILCELLNELGFDDVVTEYEAVAKLYD